MRFAERRLEKRLVARVTLSTRETDLAAMNAVVAPTNKDDPQNPVRPPEDRNEHGGVDERIRLNLHISHQE